MDLGGLEEMLFDLPSSQESVDDAWDYGSCDEEMLDVLLEPELTSCDLLDSQTPTTPHADLDSNELLMDDSKDFRTDTLHSHKSRLLSKPVKDRHWVIARIEQMIERIVDGLLDDNGQLSITLKSRNGITRRGRSPNATGSLPSAKTREISFPGSTVQEAWRFTVLVRMLELIHSCLIDNTIMTKRDIYYRHPDLFVKQAVVDQYVDEIACTLSIPRSLLNVTAAAKGLVAGNFSIQRADGTNLNGLNERNGMLVPRIHANDALDLSSIRWVLVIEKEATFSSLICSPHWRIMGSQGLILTAKGYPDLASREFLRHLANHSSHVPMFAIVDFDPDGIAIMSTYKHGSYRLAHENVTPKDTPTLNLHQLRWLGVQSHHISRTPVTESDTDNGTIVDAQGLMRLTPRDRVKARTMLEWDLCAENGPEQTWRRELQIMLMLNIKAEMQILEEQPGGLVSWLSTKLEVRQGPGFDLGGSVSQVASTKSEDELRCS